MHARFLYPKSVWNRGRRAVALGLALLLAAPAVSAQPKIAKDLLTKGLGSAAGSAAGWAARFALNAVASAMYSGHCGEDQVSDSFGELLCGVAEDVTGKADEMWRAETGAKLVAIKSQLNEVLEGQKEINQAISRQSGALRTAIESLPAQVNVQADLVRIQTAWSAFHGFFRAVEPKDAESLRLAMRRLAKDLLNNPAYNVEASARALRVAIVEGPGGHLPLPLLLARQIDAWGRVDRKPEEWDTKDPKDFDIGPQYLQLELAMQQWLLRQQQAEVLYLWAARVLEGTPDAPRLTAREYRNEYRRSIEEQTESFQHAVEWLVLANSFPRSPFATFLPAGADEVFARADVLEAMALSTPDDVADQSAGQAIWGRVIAMGEGPGSTLTLREPVSRRALSLEASDSHRVALAGWDELDWWDASDRSQPLTFDRIHFGTEWTVYRFKLPLANGARLSEYRFAPEDPGNALPLLPLAVQVDNSLADFTGRESERFGSFVGIARAGGGYALFSGGFNQSGDEDWGEADHRQYKHRDMQERLRKTDRERGTLVRVAVGEQVTIRNGRLDPPRQYERNQFAVSRFVRRTEQSQKTIRAGDGQMANLKLHVVWNEDELGMQRLKQPPARALMGSQEFQNYLDDGFIRRRATINNRVVLRFASPHGTPFNGIQESLSQEIATGESAGLDRAFGKRSTADVVLPPSGLPILVSAEVGVEFPRAQGERRWTLLARASWQTAYLTR